MYVWNPRNHQMPYMPLWPSYIEKIHLFNFSFETSSKKQSWAIFLAGRIFSSDGKSNLNLSIPRKIKRQDKNELLESPNPGFSMMYKESDSFSGENKYLSPLLRVSYRPICYKFKNHHVTERTIHLQQLENFLCRTLHIYMCWLLMKNSLVVCDFFCV